MFIWLINVPLKRKSSLSLKTIPEGSGMHHICGSIASSLKGPPLSFWRVEAFAAPVALKETETTNVIGTQRKKEHLIDVPQVLTSFYFYSPGSYRIENEVLADTSIPETFLKFPPLFANTIDQWLK